MRSPFGNRPDPVPESDVEVDLAELSTGQAAGAGGADADVVTRLAAEHLPHGIRERWMALLRPAVQLVPAADGEADAEVQVARLGGLPSLPEHVAWPVWEGHGPLSFIGELRCEALARFDLELTLPESGRLLFFYFDGSYDDHEATVGTWDVETLRGARALHVADPEPASRTPAPDGIMVYPERWWSGRAIVTAPGWEHPDLSAEFRGPDDDDDTFMDHPVNADEFNDSLHERWGTQLHQVGGYADLVQGPVEAEVAQAVLGAEVSHDDPRLEAEARRWELLLQIASDDDLAMMWGDVGTLYWMARPEDLAAGDTSQVSFTWQC